MHSLSRVLATVVVAAGLALAVLAAPARAQSPERILDYRVGLQIETDGMLLVSERIAYDFGTAERHGIFRDVPVRFRYDDRYDRVYPLQVLEVSGSPGTPVQYTLEDVDTTLRIRVGDPDQTITGRYDYTIVYRVEGTLNGFADHDELYWNAIGTDWEVPIEQASRRSASLAAIGQAACWCSTGLFHRSCASSATDGRGAPCYHRPGPKGGPHRGGGVPDRGGAGPTTGPGGALEPGLGVLGDSGHAWNGRWGPGGRAGLAWLAVRGRRSGPPWWMIRWDAAGAMVEAVPPEGIRSAQAGLLVDEVVSPVAVPATLVDLAVRGYLRIGG